MNVYDSIKYAAREGLTIRFLSNYEQVRVLDDEGTVLGQSIWHSENGLVTPVTATIRALREARLKRPVLKT